MSKFREFQQTLKKSNTDVAVVTETKIPAAKLTPYESAIPGYSGPLRRDRSEAGCCTAIWIPSSTTTLTNMTRPIMKYYGLLCRLSHVTSLSLAQFTALDRVQTLM